MSRSPRLSIHKRSVQRMALKNGDIVAAVQPVVDINRCERCRYAACDPNKCAAESVREAEMLHGKGGSS
ncbi:MAG: hypothetical protein ACW968_07585 [Candidatus Thorarchaeota archaeon]|jgi:invasion protein IalB